MASNSWQSTNITTNTTTVVKGGTAILGLITINTKGGSGNTATIYNNASAGSGTKIATIDTTAAGVGSLFYSVPCTLGITIVTATGTAPDLTVMWE